MQPGPRYSLIIPTFKRPDEVEECLQSLTLQTFGDFEVIIADGTPDQSLESVVKPFSGKLELTFLHEEYLGVSEARNLGFQHAKGEYIIFLDSDCIIPQGYLQAVDEHLQKEHLDLFGGPDAAAEDFTPLQKAISYAMTSLLTTGGIRGKKKHVGTYHPRSFNMGIRKSVFMAVGGFSDFKCGEDIELSIRIIKAGYRSGLVEEAFVYHKRRTSFRQFYRQVYRFGAARINIGKRHSGEIKPAHLFPFLFSAGLLLSILMLLLWTHIGILMLGVYMLYLSSLFLHSSIENQSIQVGFLSVAAALVQFFGYGRGMLDNALEVHVKGNDKGIRL